MGEAATVPRWERWQVRFSAADLEAYARQLDYFGIELAAMGGGRANVDYASQLSRPRPLRRAGRSQDEQRLYMTWRSGELIEADRQLLAKAGIATADRVILQFYPPQAEAMLASLERQEAGEKDLRSIRRTVFGVRPKGRQFEFFVISQDHWDAP
jgi:hypothetical protein